MSGATVHDGTASLSGVRILMTADAVGGVWTYALDLAAGLVRHGASIRLAVLGPEPSAEQRRAARAVPGLEPIETGLPLDWLSDDPAAILRAGAEIAALARAEGADLVHLNSPALAACGAFDRPVLGVCHSCLATWWEAVRTGPMPPDFAWRTDALAAGYAACDTLVAPSAAFARSTAQAYGIAAPVAIHNGRRPLPAVDPVSDEPFVFTAARLWDAGKNLALLDDAAGRLEMPVLVAGPTEGPNGARIELRRVRALGVLSDADLARHLAARPIFCSPALYEPFGLAVLEAAAAGCALVLTDIPTFRELWNGAAVFVPPGDPAALAGALERLSTDSAEQQRLGRAAKARAALYSVEAMAERMAAAYGDLLGTHTRGPARGAKARLEAVR